MKKAIFLGLLGMLIMNLCGCLTPPPSKTNNICDIYHQYPKWYASAQKAQKRWGTPVHVQMAIIHQESRFKADAKPGRNKLFGFIPWTRKSTSYGYSQAKDSTWDVYKKATKNRSAGRDNFEDATDFVAWYGHYAHQKLGISKWNAKQLYLAYHEGIGGYKKRTYRSKKWLLGVADKVHNRASQYRQQLNTCKHKIRKPWFGFW